MKREASYIEMWSEAMPELRPSLAAMKAAKVIAPFALILLWPASGYAQTMPIILGNGFDFVSTEIALARPHTSELNPIMGSHVSQRVIVKSLGTVAQVWIVKRIGREHPKLSKILGYSIGIGLSSVAIRNLAVRSH